MIYQPIEKLDALMSGALQERFGSALREVLANVRDPNTSATVKRSITLTITIAPSAGRDVAEMSVQTKTKLAPPDAASSTIYLAYGDDGSVTATEKLDQVPGQINMAGDETPLPNVVTFESKN